MPKKPGTPPHKLPSLGQGKPPEGPAQTLKSRMPDRSPKPVRRKPQMWGKGK